VIDGLRRGSGSLGSLIGSGRGVLRVEGAFGRQRGRREGGFGSGGHHRGVIEGENVSPGRGAFGSGGVNGGGGEEGGGAKGVIAFASGGEGRGRWRLVEDDVGEEIVEVIVVEEIHFLHKKKDDLIESVKKLGFNSKISLHPLIYNEMS